MIHMSIDNDETLENTCQECQDRAAEDRCISCGKSTDIENINPNFDAELFEKLKSNVK